MTQFWTAAGTLWAGRILDRVSVVGGAIAILLGGQATSGATEDWREVGVQLETYCFDCHDGATQKGKLDLQALVDSESVATQYDLWEKVISAVRDGNMPPRKADQPSEGERSEIVDGIGARLDGIDWTRIKRAGHVTLPRMNHLEYSNSLRDLLGWDLDLTGRFPAERVGKTGYSTDRDVLVIEDALLETYLAVADSVLEDFIHGDTPSSTTKVEAEVFGSDMSNHPEFGQMIGHKDSAIHTYIKTGQSGIFELSLRAWSYRDRRDELPGLVVMVDSEMVAEETVLATEAEPGDYKVLVRLKKGLHKISLSRSIRKPTLEEFEMALPPKPTFTEKVRYDYHPWFSVAVDHLAVRGPLWEAPTGALVERASPDRDALAREKDFKDSATRFTREEKEALAKRGIKGKEATKPLAAAVTKRLEEAGFAGHDGFKMRVQKGMRAPRFDGRGLPDHFKGTVWMAPAEPIEFSGVPDVEKVFFTSPGDGVESRKATARKIVNKFASLAFRRPVTIEEIDLLMGPCERKLDGGSGFKDAIKLSLMAVLVSPHFLYRVELAPGDGSDERRLSDYELASRLSFFLWMSIPDAELLRLAGEHRLSDSAIFEKQVQRLLDDPKSRAFTSSFVRQWLGYGELGRTIRLDKKRFPEFDEQLLADMVEETATFFDSLVRENGSLLELIDSDYSFLNERLAKHYGISGVEGPEFRRVNLGNSPRGGVLGMASVLTASSANPTRTSPVNRGHYVLEKFFGERLEAPDLVPSLPENAGSPEAVLSFRQELEKHRESRNCAVCHDRIDPIGFGLENFDSIGRWRTEAGGKPVDSRGVLPSGETFSSPKELSSLLLKKKEDLVENLVEQMLRFSLGRELEYYDVPVVKSIASTLARDGYRARTLLLEIARSYPFRHQNKSP